MPRVLRGAGRKPEFEKLEPWHGAENPTLSLSVFVDIDDERAPAFAQVLGDGRKRAQPRSEADVADGFHGPR